MLVLCADHGMSDTGSHGGSSEPEVNTPLVLISPAFRRKGECVSSPLLYSPLSSPPPPLYPPLLPISPLPSGCEQLCDCTVMCRLVHEQAVMNVSQHLRVNVIIVSFFICSILVSFCLFVFPCQLVTRKEMNPS